MYISQEIKNEKPSNKKVFSRKKEKKKRLNKKSLPFLYCLIFTMINFKG